MLIRRFRTPILFFILMVSLAALLVIDFAQAGAQEHTYFVATHGSDQSGDGSPENPWATISHAIDLVPDGSSILVKPGTYTGRVRLRGTFEQGVIIRSRSDVNQDGKANGLDLQAVINNMMQGLARE